MYLLVRRDNNSFLKALLDTMKTKVQAKAAVPVSESWKKSRAVYAPKTKKSTAKSKKKSRRSLSAVARNISDAPDTNSIAKEALISDDSSPDSISIETIAKSASSVQLSTIASKSHYLTDLLHS